MSPCFFLFVSRLLLFLCFICAYVCYVLWIKESTRTTSQSEATFTGSRSTKELSNSLEDEHVPATTGQAVSVEEGDDEGGNERSDARTCETEDDGEDTQADVAGRVSQQRAEERGNATQHQG